jgi:hypothetical protein
VSAIILKNPDFQVLIVPQLDSLTGGATSRISNYKSGTSADVSLELRARGVLAFRRSAITSSIAPGAAVMPLNDRLAVDPVGIN